MHIIFYYYNNYFYCLAHQSHVTVYVNSSDDAYFNLRTSDLGHCLSPTYDYQYNCEFQNDGYSHWCTGYYLRHTYIYAQGTNITQLHLNHDSYPTSGITVLHMQISITCRQFNSSWPNSANLNFSLNFQGLLLQIAIP